MNLKVCIKPVEVKKEPSSQVAAIQIGLEGVPATEVGADGSTTELKKVDITLADCLACR
jgi:hypothetical protein